MELNKFIDKLVEESKKNGFDECEIYFSSRESLSINVYKEDVDKYNLNNSFGLSFRGMLKNKLGYSYTEVLDEDAISMLIEKAKESALSIDNNDLQFIYEGDSEYQKVNTYYKELENVKADKLIEIALGMEKKCKEINENVSNFSGCGVGYTSGSYGIRNSKGLDLKNDVNLLTAYVVPVIKYGDEVQDGMGYVTATSLEEVNIDKIANDAINEALSKLGATSVSSGKYKIIIKNEAMSSMLETFSSIFSGEAAQKGLSLLANKEGTEIASSNVNLVDNPLLERGLSTVSFDDEGVATYKKEIIKNGVLQTLLHNLKTANKAGVKSTGNGFKASYASPINVSPTNMYLEPGNKNFDELVKDVNEGLIITEFAGMHSGASSITGDFSLAAKGFYINKGKKDFSVDQITVAGNFFELLKNIETIGNDLIFPMSSVGSPSVVIKELSVAGN